MRMDKETEKDTSYLGEEKVEILYLSQKNKRKDM